MKLSILFPCYNEEKNIIRIPKELIPELENLGYDYEIILIDDGSRDDTVHIAHNLNIPQLKIVMHSHNMGAGVAFRTGIKNINSDLCITMDADFTFHPKYIKDLLERYSKGDVDFVGGSPNLAGYGDDIQKWRVLISKSSNAIYSVLFGSTITAASPFFRLYKSKDLKELDLQASGFDISVEILFKLLQSNKKYAEVPVPLTVRQFGESKLNYKKEIIRHIKLLFKVVNWRLKSIF